MTRPRTTTRDRVEQAIARGDSLDRIVERLGVEPGFVDQVLRRMDHAADCADDDDEELPPLFTYQGRRLSSYFGPADPSTIAELIDILVPRGRDDAERDETIAELAAGGLSDTEIAERVGMTRQGVTSARRRIGGRKCAAA